ncbi:serine hydrolase domain-containing protein [Tenacibaculum agarivorans]|uniref:serine hydrolase domain-containing protein n=1 Tax=Tenacibaculum agarivorans TaxID=1908389 RepID=UPI001F32987A|nr:serine hydrolase domain-containing protein [Tenacibaculum agarivorans]
MKKILLLFLIGINTFSQEINAKKLDAYFSVLEEKDKLFSSSSVIKNGEIIYRKTIGYADISKAQKNTVDTKFRIGSITKTFTSVLILKAIEANKIKLETTLDTYFPDVKNAKKITIKNLLNHSSGIFNFTNDASYLTYYTSEKTRKEILDIIYSFKPSFNPGEKHSYSNSNYVLLSFILEDIYQKSYATLLQDNIVSPLGLKNTQVGSTINLNSNECNSYKKNGNWRIAAETDMSIPLGAGCIISTPSDLVMFIDALFEYKIVSKESVSEMIKLDEGYGLGIFSYPFRKEKGYGHNGGIDGFHSVLMYFPKDRIGIATTSNGVADFTLNDLSIVLLRAAYGKEFDLPDFSEIKIDENKLNELTGVYASNSFPLKITIRVVDGKLSAQATGQSSFVLKAKNDSVFTFKQAGIVLEFNREKQEMTLKQGGGVFTLTKE